MKNHIGSIFGLIGIILSIYFYSLSKQERVPVFEVSKFPTLIADTNDLNESKIKVLDSNDHLIEGEVWSLEFIFYNIGNIPLKDEEILKNLEIRLTDFYSVVLDYRINIQSRPDIIEGSLKELSNGLLLEYKILEEDDFIRGQIIFNGNSKTSLKLTGTLEGVKKIYSEEPFNWNKFFFSLLKYLAYCFLILFTLNVVILILFKVITFLAKLVPTSLIKDSLKEKLISTFSLQKESSTSSKKDSYEMFISLAIIAILLAFNDSRPDKFEKYIIQETDSNISESDDR